MGIFQKWVGILNFCGNFSKILIGLSPICHLCIYVGPLWQFEHVLRDFSIFSCILHKSFALLHDWCLSKCPSDILVLNWTQVSSNVSFLSCLVMLTMFWYLSLCFTHFAHVARTRHPSAPPMHLMLQSHASAHAHTCINTCTHMHTLLY